MDFSDALNVLKASGNSIARGGWNGKHRLVLQLPDAHSVNSEPYIAIHPEKGGRVPWVASQEDLLADDWFACSKAGSAEGTL